MRQSGRPRLDVEDADFENVARSGAADEDRTGTDVHAQSFPGAASEQRGIHRSGAAPVDGLALAGPAKDAFGAHIAGDHALGVVVGVVRQHLDGDDVAGLDFEYRGQRTAEITPVNRVGICR